MLFLYKGLITFILSESLGWLPYKKVCKCIFSLTENSWHFLENSKRTFAEFASWYINVISDLLVKYSFFSVVKQRYTKDKYALLKESSYLGLWQSLAPTRRVQVVSSAAAKSLLVNASASWWQVVEFQKLSHRLDTDVGRRRRYFGAHFVQGHLFPYQGRSFLGKHFRVWRVHDIQINWSMRSVPAWIRFGIVVLVCGGHRP